jgi:DNA-binding transcriptional MerR regulator
MPDGEKVGEVARRFGVNPQTIRQWSEQFAPYLSESANPKRGNTRHFTMDDLQVFALVAYMRGRDATFEDIRTALQSGQRGLMMELATSSGLPSDSAEPPMGGVSAGGYLARVEDLAQNLGFVRGELSRVEGELATEREAHERTRQRESEARERAARAEGVLEASQKQLPPPLPSEPRDAKIWRWVLVAGVVAIVALLIVLAVQGVG